MNEEILTVDELAAVLRCTPRTAYRMLEQGKITAVRVGACPNGHWRITSSAIREFLNGGGGGGKQTAMPREAA